MLLDLVIPYYGRADYLIHAVESVLAQDSDQLRLTVVDDAYPGSEAADYLRGVDDSRLRFLRNERNLGLNRNFQRSLDLVEAPYCVFMGGDDLLLPGYVASVTTAIASDDWEIYQPGVRVIDDAGAEVLPLADQVKRWLWPRRRPCTLSGRRAARRLCIGDWLYFPSLCWRTDAIRPVGFTPDLRVALDLDLILTVLSQGGRLRVSDDAVFAYRRHEASESFPGARQGSRFEEEAQVYREAAQRFSAAGWRSASLAARARPTSRGHALLSAVQLARRGELPAARDVVRTATGS